MPSQAEMAEVTKLIEARLDSRYMRDDGVVGGDDPTWSGYERVIETIDGKLTWTELTEWERETILQSDVTWKGFTPEDTLDVIGSVISGYPPERWMDGVRMEMIAERFEPMGAATPEELVESAAGQIEWVKSMSFILEEGKAPEPCSDCFLPWWENLSQEEQKAALMEHVDWSGIEANRDEMITAALHPESPERLERQADEYFGSRELETMFHDIANPPDFNVERLTPELAEEWRVDQQAARLCDTGQDYEGFLREANPELADYERLLNQARRPANDNEKGMER